MQDIVFLLDGSGSLGPAGFAAGKDFAKKFAASYNGTGQISILLFSGPLTWKDYYTCSEDVKAELTDDVLKNTCGLDLVQTLSNDTSKTIETIDGLAFPGLTTFTSGALLLAKNVLAFARPEAEKIVVLLTDGIPIDQGNTKKAAKELKNMGVRIVTVALEGYGLGEEGLDFLREKVASKNKKDNSIDVRDAEVLGEISTTNTLVEDVCGLQVQVPKFELKLREFPTDTR